MENTFQFASRHELFSHAAWASMVLAYIALQEEDFHSAATWHSRATNQAPAIEDRSCRDSLAYIRARVALQEGDLQLVAAYLDDFADVYSTGTVLQRQCYASLRSGMAISRGESLDPVDVELRAKEFQKSCRSGFQDFHALSNYRALLAVGESTRARALLADYITQRRERGALPPSLETLRTELGL